MESRIEMSESIKAISMALFNFHAEVGKVGKSSTNPFFKSKYASLPAILDAVAEPLNKSGLIITQFPVGTHGLETLLIHAESGEYFRGFYEMRPIKDDPQGAGIVITYQRRYAIGAILNLNIDEDDDGNRASGVGQKVQQIKFISSTQQHALLELATKAKATEQAVCKAFKVKDFASIPVSGYAKVLTTLQKKVDSLDNT